MALVNKKSKEKSMSCPRCGTEGHCFCWTKWSGGKRDDLLTAQEKEEEINFPDYDCRHELYLGEDNKRTGVLWRRERQ